MFDLIRLLNPKINPEHSGLCPPDDGSLVLSNISGATTKSAIERTGGLCLLVKAFLLGSALFTLSTSHLTAATWTVTHLTGDSDSGVSSELVYTCAVNVHGTEDKVVNGVTFKAESGTSGEGWEISQNFQATHNGRTSTVGGKIGEVLSNRMRYNGDPQKLKMTGLTPGETYVFTIYNQAWDVGETRTAILSLDATDETITANQGEFSTMAQDGQLVQCVYVADDTDVEFTVDPQTIATWHLYGFSNAVFPRLVPTLNLDNTNPAEQLATLEWKVDTTDFTVEDISVVKATISDFQVISPRKQTFKLTPSSNNTIFSVSIEAGSLKVGDEDNDAFTRSFRHYVPTFDNTATPLSFFTANIGKPPVVWFDAGDANTITGSAPVTRWQDKSGNERHAESGGGTPSLNPTSGPGGGPVIEIRRAGGDDYLSIGGSAFFAKEHYYVFRSSDAANKFDYFGAVLGHQSGRGSNYLFENGKTHFHGNQHATGVQQNGGAYVTTGSRNLSKVNEFMILRVVVNDGSTGLKGNYRIGIVDKSFCASLDIAEVVAFDSVLPDLGRQKLEGYLARKWGLLDKIDPNHPFRSEPPVVTLNGESYMRVPIGTAYTEPGATATDPEDGDLDTVEITYEGPWTAPSALAADTYGGLQLWLKADAGAEEGTWVDQSGNSRDATAHGSPTLVANSLNGLPVMHYSGTDGEYHDFPEMRDIRTIFWVVKRSSGKYCFLLGDNNNLHFHTENNRFWHGSHTHANIRNGVLAVNGNTVDGLNSNVPTEMSIISLRTTGNVEASNFSRDRNSGGRYWSGDLGELLIYNTALTDEEIADVEVRLGLKWGLPFNKLITTHDALDTSILGDWNVVYKATDSLGGTATAERQVRVFDPTAPVITLVGEAAIHHELNTDFEDPGYTLADAAGTALDIAGVKVEGHLDSSRTGTYVLSYNYTDTEGRAAETLFRSVEISDSLPPQITLTGGATIKHPLGQPFVEPGFSATDIVDGDVFVQSSLFETGIRHQGFQIGGPDSNLDFNQNGGLLTRVPLGENVLKTALDFQGDDSFRNAGVGITRPDNYNNLFTGLFVARVGGQYQFQIAGRDDRGSFWFDVNGNGLFEENGSAGSEWMNGGYNEGLSSVDLSPGLYRFAIGHTEYGGGSRITARFSTPPGGGPSSLVNIDPSQGNQAGLWVIENPFNTGAVGTQTITYTATDAAGNIATVTRTVEIIDLSAQPVITLKGRAIMKHEQYAEFVDPGVELTDAAGTVIDAAGVQVSGHFDVNAAGTYELLYTYFDENQVPAESRIRIVEVSDTVAPTVTIVGDAEIEHVQGQPFTDPGATLGEDPEKDLFVISTAQLPSQGLWLHLDSGNISGLSPGDQVLRWTDISGNGNHLSDVRGNPVLVADSINGRSAVRVDGDDFLAVTKDVQRKYSVFTVSRWSGSKKGRLIGSRNANWFMGYFAGKEDTFHPEGWASGYSTNITTAPHIYSATSTGSDSVRFYGDGADLTTDTKRNGRIGKIQVGGHGEAGDPSSGDVAEILIYNNYVVTEQERLTIEGILAVKYGLLGFPKHDLPDLNKVGDHTIHYLVRDLAGNVGSTTRKVTVKPDNSIPIITLNGESQIRHEAATEFTDPGATVKDGEGNDLDAGGLVVTGTVDSSVLGLQVLTYNYTADGKSAQELTRNVIVEDTTGPVLSMAGDALVRIQVGADYSDAGATANDSLDGDLTVYFDKDIPADGLVLHLDAGSFRGLISHGDTISTSWPDLSSEGNHADNVSGDPKWIEDGLNGRPVVNFDGDDLIWTTKNFEPDLANYTILSVARYTGGDSERVISTRSRNYMFGFHGGSVRRFHADGWASNQNVGDTFWHLHVGDANDQDRANFWVDGAQFANNSTGLHNTNYKPDQIQLGGWRTNSEMSKCEVAELIVYNRVISTEEREKLSNILNSKYGLSSGGGFAYVNVDTSKPATHSIKYTVSDNSGNLSEVVRTIIVSGDENKPFIVMNGEVIKTIEAGSIVNYTDPGAVAKSADGTTLKDDLSGQGDTIDLLTPGTYTLSYNFSDADTAIRTIRVVDTLGPAITLTGDEPLKLFVDAPFQDPGATSVDQRDGETPVYSDYLVIPDTLRLEYHTRGQAIELLHLENEGGVLAHTPAVSGYFTDGVHGDGINFLTDQDFKDISGVNRNDAYQLVFSGLFDARRGGNYGFATSKQDGNDYCTIWVDKDRDGLLEKQGDLGDEQVVWDNQIGSVYLGKGKYRVVIAYAEWNGNSRFNARFSTPEGAGPFSLTNIHPGAPGQEGLWSTIPRVIDTSVPGEHTVTYFADDKVGNRSTLTRNIIVEEDNQKPVIHLLGGNGLNHHVGFPYKDDGVLLDDYQGNPLDETKVQVSGVPDGMSEGTFTIFYEYTDPEGHVALPVSRTVIVADIVGPVITINGANPATVQLNEAYNDAGAVAIDAFDGPVKVIHNIGFNKEGLVLHLDAGSFNGKLNDGDVIAIDWEDLSGKGNHGDNQVGDPKWLKSGLNGQPVVDFNGNDIIWTTKDFEPDLAHYSIFSVARYSGGGNNRVISSRGRNWFFGFHGNTIRRFHSDGWAWNQGGADHNWHIHMGDVNDKDQANFWLDGTHLAKNSNGLHDINYKPQNINLGGFNDSNERSKCQIAELILFDRVVSAEEREYIELYLKSKYDLNGGGDLVFSPVDTTKAGEYTFNYTSTDAAGNKAVVNRTVIVVDQPDLPVITLNGEAELIHPTGEAYEDAGATVADSQGTPLDASKLAIRNTVNTDLPGKYIVSYDYATGGDDNANGTVEKVWEFATGDSVAWSSPAISSDGTLYFGSWDDKLYALNSQTGVKLWEFETGANVSSSAIIGSDGTVYFGSDDDKLYALNGQTGVKVWEFTAGSDVYSSPAIGADGTVYVGSKDKKLHAINGQTGVKIWEFESGGTFYSSPAIGTDGTVYVGSFDKKVYALNGQTGVKIWEFATGEIIYSSPSIGTDGTVYVGSVDRKLYAINGKSGVKLWEFETGGWVSSSPAIGPDGTVYIGSYDKKLYALQGSSGQAGTTSAVTITRTVTVVDQTPPVITLEGGDRIIHQLGNPFTDPGFSASDLVDGPLMVESSMLMENRIRVRGYMETSVDALLDLNDNGGLFLSAPVGENFKYSGSTYIRADAAFRKIIPEITRNDSFQILLDGHFKTKGGRYEFGIEQPNDRAAFWIDLDGDGTFETNGDKGPELMNPGLEHGYTEVDLSSGYHRFAIAFREGGGHSQVEARYRAVQGEGPGSLTTINPGSPDQSGHWVVYNPIDVLAPGEHQITYTATDSVGNEGKIVRTVVVKNNPDAGIITLNGDAVMDVAYNSTFTDPGVTVTDLDGNALSLDKLVVTGEVDTSALGEYVLEYNYNAAEGVPSRTEYRTVVVTETEPPVITLNGDAEMTVFKGSQFVDPGASATDNYDGDFVVVGSSETFPQDGLFAHLDASRILGKVEGDPVTLWYDQSSSRNHADAFKGAPTYATNAINGRPGVYFDGESLLSLGKSVGVKYSIITVSRLAGIPHARLLSSRDQNWLLGYHGGFVDCFHPGNGWAAERIVPSTEEPHLYSAISGDMSVRFFADGVDKTTNSIRKDNTYSMGYFQMGGWNDLSESSTGFVSEVIIYDRILSTSERMGIEARLNSKYSLNGVTGASTPVDTSTAGEYSVIYQSVDGFGNFATKVRKVTVVEDPNAPSITLNGDAFVIHEASQEYSDAGAVLKDSQGNVLDAALLEVLNTVVPSVPGEYSISYNYQPTNGNPAPGATRVVQVVDTLTPEITLSGPSTVKLSVGATFTDPGVSATDQASGVTQAFSDLEYVPGYLLHQGYLEDPGSDADLNLDNDGGLLAKQAVGSSHFVNGPGNRGIQFVNDNEFRAAVPEINRNDRYQSMISGALIAPRNGTYELGISRQDDRVAIWLDLDRDGTFESAGDKGNEQIRNAGQQGYVDLELEAGLYRVAFLHREGGGGSFMHIGITLPGGSRMNVQPGHPSQQGLWAGTSEATLDTSQPGIHTVTYRSVDAVGNMGTATRTVVVVADATLPFIAINGAHHLEHEAGKSFTDAGAVVTDADGNVLEANLAGQGTVDTNTPGEYSLTYDFTDGAGKAAVQVVRKVTVVDNAAPVVALKPHPTFGGTDIVKLFAGQPWEDPGIEVTDFDSSTWSVSSREYLPNRLEHRGFMLTTNDALIDFKENGGLFSHVPVGQGAFTDGPLGKGFDFANDQDFRRGPSGISRYDQYQTLVHGYFKAVVAGDYQFSTDNADDRITLWMDLDQDGIFETTGDNGAERITWHNATVTKTLEPGYYRVAIGHTEGGGGARGRVRFQTPEGAGPSTELTVLKPSAPGQQGIWFAEGAGPIDTTHPGNHAITYFASDSSGNISTVKRAVIVEIDPDAPVLTLLGDAEIAHDLGLAFEDPGVSIKDGSGADLPSAGLVLAITRNGAAVENVDGTVTGTYQILYDFTDSSNRKAIPVNRTVVVADTTPPVITLVGDSSVQMPPGAIYEDSGATAVDALDGDVEVTVTSSSPAYGQMPGLLKGGLSGWNKTLDNNGIYGVEPLGPSIDKIAWRGNYTFIYSGQIYDADGVMSFREDIDDGAWLKIDGQQLLDDSGSNTVTTKAVDLGRGGWFDFELRLYNNGGGAGQVTAPGFGWDAEGGANYVVPANSDEQTIDLFRTEGPLPGTVTAKSESVQTLTYTATDAAGNTATLIREIIIKDDPTLPIIKLLGEEALTHEAGTDYVDAGATVEDSRGTALDSSKLTISGSVDVKKLGQYSITYDYTNDKGKKATPLKRRITVLDTTAPVVTLIDGSPLQVNVGKPFVDPGVTVTDNLDEGLVPVVRLENALEGLVANWNFDEGSGDKAVDNLTGLTGVLTNFENPDTAWKDGKFGKALEFDGTNDYILIPPSGELDLDTLTISAWINSAEYAQNGFIFEKTTNGVMNTQYSFFLNSTDEVIFRLVAGGNLQDASVPANANLNLNEWNHIAATYDGNVRSLYINGEFKAAIPGIITINKNPGGNSSIGALGSGNDFFFSGMIDDIQIYNRAIPEADILKLQKPVGIDTSQKSFDPYILSYTAVDSSGNTTKVTREVVVSNDTTVPVITLEGDAEVTVVLNTTYEDFGATAFDQEDGNLTPFIDDGGSVDAVDTTKAGEYIVTYDVADFSGNNAVQVTRKVIVTGGTPVDQWINEKLAGLSTADKALDADPDKDGIPNLLEYALAGDPQLADRTTVLPVLDVSGDKLSFTYFRVKASIDSSITFKPQLTTNLGDVSAWSESDVNVKGALQGVEQSDLPDDKPFASSRYERVQVEAKTAMNAETAGRQFIRVVVDRQ